MPREIPRNITFLTVTVFFYLHFSNLILDAHLVQGPGFFSVISFAKTTFILILNVPQQGCT
jgi:hypothetical protein